MKYVSLSRLTNHGVCVGQARKPDVRFLRNFDEVEA